METSTRTPATAERTVHPFRLGFAAKILGDGGIPTADTRRWQSGPSLTRSLELLVPALEYLGRTGIRMFRLSSQSIPYGTHPDLPQFDYRRQIEANGPALAALGGRATSLGLRLSTHPGQYTVINGPDEELTRKSSLDLEQDAALLDALGQGPEAVVVVHVGGLYGDRELALARWARAYDRLSDAARRRVVLENDDHLFGVDDALELHRRTGVPVVYDHHHHRVLGGPDALPPDEALAAACATWPDGVRPKVHLSSPRVDLEMTQRPVAGTRRREAVPVMPRLLAHADFVTPWDLAELLHAAPGPLDVMLEAKAKDLALLWVRGHLERLMPHLAAAEERGAPGPEPRPGLVGEPGFEPGTDRI